ncbi:MAG: hypothetical protein ACK53E_08805, partial [Pseudanabaena sp.]
ATKSAISPDVNISQPSSPTPSQSAISPAPNRFEIKSSEIKTERNSPPIETRDSVQFNIETPSRVSSKTEVERSQPVEILLENRSTGCQAKASDLSGRNANLCAPEVIVGSQKQYY